jgi:4-amino-4-deoxy-L-arabinose transferase-like glycosyltransferase
MTLFSGGHRPVEALTRRNVTIGMVLAVLLLLVQTLPFFGSRWLPDESWYSAPAYSIATGHGLANPAIGPNDLEHSIDARPPGTALAIAASFRLFGVGPASARLVSLVAGVALVVFVFLLGRELFGDYGALMAAALAATDNFVVMASRTARPEALATCFILGALFCAARYARAGRLWCAGAGGLLMAAGTMCHVTILGYIISAFLLFLLIDLRSVRTFWRSVAVYCASYIVGLVPYATWILTAPLGRAGFNQEFLSRAVGSSFFAKFQAEWARYHDFVGIGIAHGHGLDGLPLRLPVALIFLGFVLVLWRWGRRWLLLEILFLLPTMLWLVYTVNKTSRYLCLLSPLLALSFGAAIAVTCDNARVRRWVLAAGCFAMVIQAGANLFLLKAARSANFSQVEVQLRRAVPAGEPVYGTMTFWMAFPDRQFVAYERTDPFKAAREDGVRYFIIGDRSMVNGFPGDEAFYRTLNVQVSELISHCKPVAKIEDDYYGHLSVYELVDAQSLLRN